MKNIHLCALFVFCALCAPAAPRNLALHRAVYQSDAYDYNLCGHLLTDGIRSAAVPSMEAWACGTPLPKREREWALDGSQWSRNTLVGTPATLRYRWHGLRVAADAVRLTATVAYREAEARGGATFTVRAGRQVIGRLHTDTLPGRPMRWRMHSDPNKQEATSGDMLPVRALDLTIPLRQRVPTADLTVELAMTGAAHWAVRELAFSHRGAPVEVLPSQRFGSAWQSPGGRQWVYVDLGAVCDLSAVRLHWLRRAKSAGIAVSDDARTWRDVATLPARAARAALAETVACRTRARYVRLGTDDAETAGCVLTEMEVLGEQNVESREVESRNAESREVESREVERRNVERKGQDAAAPSAHPYSSLSTPYSLTSLNGPWRVQRASEVRATGEQLSTAAYDDAAWLAARVPATALAAYVEAGAVPEPTYDDNNNMVSESFFRANFWYRRTFSFATRPFEKTFLNLDGINWKAHIFLNGRRVGDMAGAFARGRFDVSDLVRDGQNTLAVEVVCNDHFGAVKEKTHRSTDFNGGVLGADNPTFHASIGWDWMNTVRGREAGIWNDVYLSREGSVSLADPLITTSLALPDTAATITPRVVVRNNTGKDVFGVLRFRMGGVRCETTMTVPAGAEVEQAFSADNGFDVLRGVRLPLWWPNGMGAPALHDASFEFETAGGTESTIQFKAGLRQMEYRDTETALKLYVNGRRMVPLGGNWGFPEALLRYRARDYDRAVAYHKDLHFNMIRDWVAQTADDEFYEACDRYGIMVWQDFCLANPSDGPDPADEAMFVRNARDYTRRQRHHACLALYCGRNEGVPPATIDAALRGMVQQLHPGLLYISDSADKGVSGHGPYQMLPARDYFGKQSGKLHTERGMPNVMTAEGLARTFRPEHLWPQGDAWGAHDFTMQGAQGAESFNRLVARAFGEPANAREFSQWAQWINYDGHRAMFEAANHQRQGLLMWMSHPAHPSLTWQTYDYYMEPTAGYFGAKKACEPVHVQRNALTDSVEVVCLTGGGGLPAAELAGGGGLPAAEQASSAEAQCSASPYALSATIYDMHARELCRRTASVVLKPDTTIACLSAAPPADYNGIYFLRLTLEAPAPDAASDTQPGASPYSLHATPYSLNNTYVLSTDDGNLRALRTLPAATVRAQTTIVRGKTRSRAVVQLENTGDTPALMLRLRLRDTGGRQILPAIYSDNYFHLLPAERRTITVEWQNDDAPADSKPAVDVEWQNK